MVYKYNKNPSDNRTFKIILEILLLLIKIYVHSILLLCTLSTEKHCSKRYLNMTKCLFLFI